MRVFTYVSLALLALFAVCAVSAASPSICDKYASALGTDQNTLITALVGTVFAGNTDVSSMLGGVSGSFVALEGYIPSQTFQLLYPTAPASTALPNMLDVISTANFDTVSLKVNLTGVPNPQPDTEPNWLIAVTRRPSNGNFYFIDTNGQIYTANVEEAITAATPGQTMASVAVNTLGAPNAARLNAYADNIGWGHEAHARPAEPRGWDTWQMR